MLTAISPIDGRYANKVAELSPYFSEFALIRYRVFVEIEYFIHLHKAQIPQLQALTEDQIKALRSIHSSFDVAEAQKVKNIEQTTNHDVKAVEYYIKNALHDLGLDAYKEFVHFGLTSQDINNTAVPLSLKHALEQSYYPMLDEIILHIRNLSQKYKAIPMLARTHGQAASPTGMGKEMAVFVERIEDQLKGLKALPIKAKFGGATGNFNAHIVAYPQMDWPVFADEFVDHLGLQRSRFTTQIQHYDHMAAIFDAMARINTILIDFCRDIWTYISMDYFKQRVVDGEVGSSAMPHKVNPIDFENAEGNLGMSNAILHHLSCKLPISRLQRDLTDSTVLRNIGVPFGHVLISFKSLAKGISKLMLNSDKLAEDLENNWAIVAEAIQTILRRENYPNPYEQLKTLTRKGEKITAESIKTFILQLDVPENVREELLQITPHNYTGNACQ